MVTVPATGCDETDPDLLIEFHDVALRRDGRNLVGPLNSADAVKAQIQSIIAAFRQLKDNSGDLSSTDLANAQARGAWQLQPASEERHMTLLPQTPPMLWDDLMHHHAYVQALWQLP